MAARKAIELDQLLSPFGARRLNWGSGPDTSPGWLRSDKEEWEGVQLVGDILECRRPAASLWAALPGGATGSMLAGMGNLQVFLRRGAVSPYLLGGVGAYGVKTEFDSSALPMRATSSISASTSRENATCASIDCWLPGDFGSGSTVRRVGRHARDTAE